MSEQEKITKQIEDADLATDWVDEIIDGIQNQFAKGYLTSKIEELGNSLSYDTEDYRELLLKYVNYEIWSDK